MKNWNIIYQITFILAFCSIVYELLLAQTLSAFLGNTVFQYSITIGLYMLSMGIGAFIAEGKFVKKPTTTLLIVEITLTFLGGGVVVLAHLFSLIMPSLLLFSAFTYFLIIVIGILTGMEIPLLIELRNKIKLGEENKILGIDYAGAFLGAIIFAFVFYPKIGLIPTAFFVGLLNAFSGLMIFLHRKKVATQERKQFYNLLPIQAALFAVLLLFLINASTINDYLINKYLGN